MKENEMQSLSDEQLKNVSGGIDWKAIGLAVYRKYEESGLTNPKHLEIVEAIKVKDYQRIAGLTTALLYDGDPLIKEAYENAR